MSHVDSVRELASIHNPRNEARPTILLGAGASFSSGVPLADCLAAVRCGCSNLPGAFLQTSTYIKIPPF